jgi:hypothetical protein
MAHSLVVAAAAAAALTTVTTLALAAMAALVLSVSGAGEHVSTQMQQLHYVLPRVA